MYEFTLDQKAERAAKRAADIEAEKHFYDMNVAKSGAGYFSFTERDEGHWDVYATQVYGKASAWRFSNPEGGTTEEDGATERAFCIRGEAGDVVVRDERWNPHYPHPRATIRFRSVQSATLWIIEELMQ